MTWTCGSATGEGQSEVTWTCGRATGEGQSEVTWTCGMKGLRMKGRAR